MTTWVLVTGGGSGIGRALVHHFSRTHRVLTCGRRAALLEDTRDTAPFPEAVVLCACDIGSATGRDAFVTALPADAAVSLLVHNAAIGDPAPLQTLNIQHFEEALRVNVVAPLALSQAFLPRLQRGSGRILHLGTSVAFNPQRGTATYGVTKMAFHRLYEQMNAEGMGVPVGSLSPGMVDTPGVRDHVTKARAHGLPHVAFFDQAFERGWSTPVAELMQLVDELATMDAGEFSRREWRFSEWHKERSKGAAYSAARGVSYGEWRHRLRPSPASRGVAWGACAAAAAAAALCALKLKS
jgi:NAD(P)-dependent dehydrogenase (short-subunit alcohol dehydrogenase family)